VNVLNILIVGCGKVGSYLARVLENQGHDISIVDESAKNLDPGDNIRLSGFGGLCVTGVPIDVDVLRSAGIESCDAVFAVTSNDNTNIMVAEVATRIFGIKNVTARIYDPARQEVFSDRMDIRTICPTTMTVDALIDSMMKEDD